MGKRQAVEIDHREFEQSFGSYVRDNDGQLTDTRAAAATKFAAIPAAKLVVLMEAHDLAAIFSGCIGVTNPMVVKLMAGLKGKKLSEKFEELAKDGKLPLAADPAHPAGLVLSAMLEVDDGHAMLRDMASHLAWAAEQPGMRMHLYKVPGAAPPVLAPEEPTEAEVATAEDDDSNPQHDEPGNLFDRQEGDGR